MSGEKEILVVELSPEYVWTLRGTPVEAIYRFGPCSSYTGALPWPDQDDPRLCTGDLNFRWCPRGRKTSADDLRVPSGSPSTSGAVRRTAPPSFRKDVGVPTPSKEQGLAALATPTALCWR
ncbi:hypothetical protein HPB47_001056 [Ixodes persulcatus]|uniref:Uncharacterized protein n=1 Tax=Ixodes persulcatus TaxID=34615 RepID=A0AC60PQ18_IXOPE|nr:hypothetical protein HPB47_001056 [Ixodes persulcatus]